MRERVGPRLVAGAVLYAGERTLPFGEGLWALPLNALWRDSVSPPELLVSAERV